MSNLFRILNLTLARPFEGYTSEVRPKWLTCAPRPGVSSHLDGEPPALFLLVRYGRRALENSGSRFIRAWFRSFRGNFHLKRPLAHMAIGPRLYGSNPKTKFE